MFHLALLVGMSVQGGFNPCAQALPGYDIYTAMQTNGRSLMFIHDGDCRLPVTQNCNGGGDIVCLMGQVAPSGCYTLRSGQSFGVQLGRIVRGGTYTADGDTAAEDSIQYPRTDGEYEIRSDTCSRIPERPSFKGLQGGAGGMQRGF